MHMSVNLHLGKTVRSSRLIFGRLNLVFGQGNENVKEETMSVQTPQCQLFLAMWVWH